MMPAKSRASETVAPGVGRASPQEQGQHNHERDTGENDEKQIVIPERTEGGAGVRDMDETKKFRDDDAQLFQNDVTQHQPFGDLVERVERERQQEE